MKKFLINILPVLFLALLIAACEDTGTDPIDPGPTTGSVLLQSTPVGASILVNNNPSGKSTPDSITGLSAGNHSVTLRLAGYEDTTFTVNVTAGRLTSHPHITLTPVADLAVFTNVKIWERASERFLSGIDLSTGSVVGSGTAEADLYYVGLVGNLRVIRSQHLRTNPVPATLRTTRFYNTSNTNINDGNDAPVYLNTSAQWLTEKSDDGNYAFVYDQDSHYSKIKITGFGEDGQFDRYIIVDIIYNKTANDVRF